MVWIRKISLGIILFFCLFISCNATLSSDEDSIANKSWGGIWNTGTYELILDQHENNISGEYVPSTCIPYTYDPGFLIGTISEDGTNLTGIWSESGDITMNLSDNQMSFSAVVTSNPAGKMAGPIVYYRNGTRISDFFDSKNPWAGFWTTGFKIYSLTQNGTSLTGTNHAITGIDDEPGIFKGTISDDGRTATMKWFETGNVSLLMNRNGASFNGTYRVSLDPSAEIKSWNGTKIRFR